MSIIANRSLTTVDTHIGIAEASLLKAAGALKRHGGRTRMLTKVRGIRSRLRRMDPIKEDIAPPATPVDADLDSDTLDGWIIQLEAAEPTRLTGEIMRKLLADRDRLAKLVASS